MSNLNNRHVKTVEMDGAEVEVYECWTGIRLEAEDRYFDFFIGDECINTGCPAWASDVKEWMEDGSPADSWVVETVREIQSHFGWE